MNLSDLNYLLSDQCDDVENFLFSIYKRDDHGGIIIIPVLGRIPIAMDCLGDNVVSEIVSDFGGKLPTNVFALRVIGESMQPLFVENDYALFDPNKRPTSGDIVAAIYQEDQYVRRYIERVETIELVCDNSDKAKYPTKVIPKRDIEQLKISGVCFWVQPAGRSVSSNTLIWR